MEATLFMQGYNDTSIELSRITTLPMLHQVEVGLYLNYEIVAPHRACG